MRQTYTLNHARVTVGENKDCTRCTLASEQFWHFSKISLAFIMSLFQWSCWHYQKDEQTFQKKWNIDRYVHRFVKNFTRIKWKLSSLVSTTLQVGRIKFNYTNYNKLSKLIETKTSLYDYFTLSAMSFSKLRLAKR